MKSFRTVCAPPGIGDSIWLLQKLINSGEKFNFLLPGGKPRRGKQIFDLLPQVSESCNYDPDLYFRMIELKNATDRKAFWRDIEEPEINLSANKWLETGNHISKYLPDLKTSYDLPWDTDRFYDPVTEVISGYQAREEKRCEFIGIYGSAYSTQRAWGFWGDKEWFYFIFWLYAENKNFVFVIIGAAWDTDMADMLMKKLKGFNIPYINTIGEELGWVIELMKKLTYGFYFPSGLGIISGLLGKRSMMWYPTHLEKMIGTWVAPDNNVFSEIMMNSVDDMKTFVKTKTLLL